MSFEVPTSFVQQYAQNVEFLSQQKGSRLRNAVYVKPGITGTRFDMEQIGATSAQKITGRHQDTPLIATPYDRRWTNMQDYDWADLIDRSDKIKMLIDPASSYTMNAVWAMGRAMDDEIISNAFAPASTGHDGTTNKQLPSSQVVPVNSHGYDAGTGNTGLTVSKLISAKEIIRAGNVDPDEPLYIACTEHEIANMLAQTEVKSIWYNNVKALVEGTVDRFMGFTFIQTERIQKDANGYDRVLAWAKSGLNLGIGQDINTDIGPRRDKRNAVQVYVSMSIGSSRLEEAKVVEVKCDPTA